MLAASVAAGREKQGNGEKEAKLFSRSGSDDVGTAQGFHDCDLMNEKSLMLFKWSYNS